MQGNLVTENTTDSSTQSWLNNTVGSSIVIQGAIYNGAVFTNHGSIVNGGSFHNCVPANKTTTHFVSVFQQLGTYTGSAVVSTC